jgi:tRNA A-37 threonylcarbamoyl transferase component Bud32
MLRARRLGVSTPVLYGVDHAACVIYMERVAGHSVKSLLQVLLACTGRGGEALALQQQRCPARGERVAAPSKHRKGVLA